MEMVAQMAKGFGLAISDDMVQQFEQYTDTLLEWNQKFNLTAILERPDIAVKHYLDSIILLSLVDIPQGATLIDVGTGAGFPAVPLKIMRPDLQITLLDSLNKRVEFLRNLSELLGQDNRAVHGRAEEMGRKTSYREKFKVVTARAVASMSVLCEYCLPLVEVGGVFLAMKGPDVEEEVAQADRAISLLGGKVREIKKIVLPGEYRRSVVIVEKISQTSIKYPRNAGKISKSPL